MEADADGDGRISYEANNLLKTRLILGICERDSAALTYYLQLRILARGKEEGLTWDGQDSLLVHCTAMKQCC